MNLYTLCGEEGVRILWSAKCKALKHRLQGLPPVPVTCLILNPWLCRLFWYWFDFLWKCTNRGLKQISFQLKCSGPCNICIYLIYVRDIRQYYLFTAPIILKINELITFAWNKHNICIWPYSFSYPAILSSYFVELNID
jgi:hypothetical protein